MSIDMTVRQELGEREEIDMGEFDGKVAYITGGARGQGRSHAVALAGEGASVALVDIANGERTHPPATVASEEDLRETVRLVEAKGVSAFPFPATSATRIRSWRQWPRPSRRSAASTS